jgi:small subunit ribosomal protein S20
MRADARRHRRNQAIRTELKTLTRRLREAVRAGQKEQAQAAYRLLTKRLDQAASKKVLHRNTASRRKARLARLLAG